MSFDARVHIQGAVSYVPHTDLNQLLALFPAHPGAESLRDPEGGEICDHYAVIQCRGRLLGLPDIWTSIDISGLWVGVEGAGASKLDLDQPQDSSLLPSLNSVLQPDGLAQYAAINPRALPGGNLDRDLLRAGVYVNSGEFFGDVRFQTMCDLRGGHGEILGPLGLISNTTIVALNAIDSLSFRLRALGGVDLPPIEIQPPEGDGERAEIWIRHFCDLKEPDPIGARILDPDRLDKDFVLNYTLLEKASEMIEARERYKLPAPEVNSNWAGGENLAGRPNNCAGPKNPPSGFSSPFPA